MFHDWVTQAISWMLFFSPKNVCFFVFLGEGYLIFLLGIKNRLHPGGFSHPKIKKNKKYGSGEVGMVSGSPYMGCGLLTGRKTALKVGERSRWLLVTGKKTTEWKTPPGKRPALTKTFLEAEYFFLFPDFDWKSAKTQISVHRWFRYDVIQFVFC